MNKELINSMNEAELSLVTELKNEMEKLIQIMMDSFGFEEKEDTNYHADVMNMVALMEKGEAQLRPELMEDFNALFDQITMAYFEPERFYGFFDEYRDKDGVIQLEGKNIGEFYGRTMAKLSVIKADFERYMAELR